MNVTIAIPSIRSRATFLARATDSVWAQDTDVQVCVVTHVDEPRSGAWNSRNAVLRKAFDTNPDWIGFLDDDDVLRPHHVSSLLAAAEKHSADIVWGWFEVIGGGDPFPEKRHMQLDLADPHIVPITYMARASFLKAALDAGQGFQPEAGEGWFDQDWPILKHMLQAGAKPFATEQTTWDWHHHGRNTSGLPRQNA